ncbi:helix-turn-helix domain-containing protein [Actinomadura litoris]|uniref:helix-turn-helix domain-containing protein n=1 Tax=Actinomadura litoris TaxID=2678616 RepID=UPI001FA6AA2E|nr:helix-turn-helix domain-containing protein [Actinomadura litoris]
MDTATAALQANVTVATIRTWCRRNVIGAIKVAGRWMVDATSLAYRLTLGNKPMIEPLTRAEYETAAGPGAVKDVRCHMLHRVYTQHGTTEWGDTPTDREMLAIRRGAALAAEGYTEPAPARGPGYAAGLPGQIFGGPSADRADECHYCGQALGPSSECEECV